MSRDEVTSIAIPIRYCRVSSADGLTGLAGLDRVDKVTPKVTRSTDIYRKVSAYLTG